MSGELRLPRSSARLPLLEREAPLERSARRSQMRAPGRGESPSSPARPESARRRSCAVSPRRATARDARALGARATRSSRRARSARSRHRARRPAESSRSSSEAGAIPYRIAAVALRGARRARAPTVARARGRALGRRGDARRRPAPRRGGSATCPRSSSRPTATTSSTQHIRSASCSASLATGSHDPTDAPRAALARRSRAARRPYAVDAGRALPHDVGQSVLRHRSAAGRPGGNPPHGARCGARARPV